MHFISNIIKMNRSICISSTLTILWGKLSNKIEERYFVKTDYSFLAMIDYHIFSHFFFSFRYYQRGQIAFSVGLLWLNISLDRISTPRGLCLYRCTNTLQIVNFFYILLFDTYIFQFSYIKEFSLYEKNKLNWSDRNEMFRNARLRTDVLYNSLVLSGKSNNYLKIEFHFLKPFILQIKKISCET